MLGALLLRPAQTLSVQHSMGHILVRRDSVALARQNVCAAIHAGAATHLSLSKEGCCGVFPTTVTLADTALKPRFNSTRSTIIAI